MAGKNDRFVRIVIWVIVTMMVITFAATILPAFSG